MMIFRHFFGSKTIFLKEKGMSSSPSKSLRRGYVMEVLNKSFFDGERVHNIRIKLLIKIVVLTRGKKRQFDLAISE